jgi:hypothetical protein
MFTDRPPAGDDDAGAGILERLVGDVTRCVTAGRSVTAGTGEQIAPTPGSPDAEPAARAK